MVEKIQPIPEEDVNDCFAYFGQALIRLLDALENKEHKEKAKLFLYSSSFQIMCAMGMLVYDLLNKPEEHRVMLQKMIEASKEKKFKNN